MTKDSAGSAAADAAPSRSFVWAAYAACAWALVFAALTFYWAAGGTAGAATIGDTITKPIQERDPGWIALLWAIGALKILGALLPLALVQAWGGRIPRRLLLTVAWGAGILMILYGGANMLEFALMETGILNIPASLGELAVRWHLLLWEPWWIVGGVLYVATAWSARRRTVAPDAGRGALGDAPSW
ncbi:MAG TPA: DUF3995 domain-containing protein [Ktedonobacterales bacterium]|nr:DUF3995 domain-containing protein [Ktedonobacterales bacterium]